MACLLPQFTCPSDTLSVHYRPTQHHNTHCKWSMYYFSCSLSIKTAPHVSFDGLVLCFNGNGLMGLFCFLVWSRRLIIGVLPGGKLGLSVDVSFLFVCLLGGSHSKNLVWNKCVSSWVLPIFGRKLILMWIWRQNCSISRYLGWFHFILFPLIPQPNRPFSPKWLPIFSFWWELDLQDLVNLSDWRRVAAIT